MLHAAKGRQKRCYKNGSSLVAIRIPAVVHDMGYDVGDTIARDYYT